MIQYGHLVGHVTRHLPPLYYWLSATLSFLSRISNSITLLPNGQKTALFCVPQSDRHIRSAIACSFSSKKGDNNFSKTELNGKDNAMWMGSKQDFNTVVG